MWKTLRKNPDRLEARNRKIRKLPYHEKVIMDEITNLYQNKTNTVEIARKFKVSKSTILRAMRINHISLHSSPPRYTPNFAPTYQLGYTLGVIYGDGYCWKENRKHSHFIIGLNSVDKEFVECFSFNLRRVIGREQPLKIGVVKTKEQWRSPYFSGQCSCKQLGEFIKKLTYAKLQNKFLDFPHFRIGFIRGFFDSEGCICYTKHIVRKRTLSKRHPYHLTVSVCNTDKQLLKIVQDALTIENILTSRIWSKKLEKRWNRKVLHGLGLHTNQENIKVFTLKIGTRIKRKQEKIWRWKRDWGS
jgi:intein-encoded DNA endonuclease-like protein